MAQQPCDDPQDRVDEARQALLLMDLATARAALSAAEASLGCGAVADRETLGAFWLIEGALLWFESDREGATESLQAAHRVAPELWYVDLGPALLDFYEDVADQSRGMGTLALKGVDPAYRTWVDGASMLLPQDVPAGLHVVQLGTVDEVLFGRIVYVVLDRRSAVEPELPPLERIDDVPAGVTVEQVERRPVDLDLWVGAGADAWLGRAREGEIDGVRRAEPAVKWLVPLELGVEARSARWWGRAHGTIAPVLGSGLLYRTEGDDVRSAVAGVGATAAGGWVLAERVALGVGLGATLPSRLAGRLVVGVTSEEVPLVAEARLGANVLTDGTAEPAVMMVLGFRPRLTRLEP